MNKIKNKYNLKEILKKYEWNDADIEASESSFEDFIKEVNASLSERCSSHRYVWNEENLYTIYVNMKIDSNKDLELSWNEARYSNPEGPIRFDCKIKDIPVDNEGNYNYVYDSEFWIVGTDLN